MSRSVSLPLVLPLSTTFNIIVIGHLSHATSILIGLFGFGISYHLLIFPILFIPHIKQQLLCYLWDHFLLQFDSTNTCTFHFHCPCNSCIATYFFLFFWAIPCVGGRPSTLLLNQVYHYCIPSRQCVVKY